MALGRVAPRGVAVRAREPAGSPPAPAFVLACCACWLSVASGAHAQTGPSVGTSSSGLRGLLNTSLPVPEHELTLAASAGYGLTERLPPVDGTHSRAQGSLAAALGPLPWLAFALRLDGRYDSHPDDGLGAHSGGTGDPRIHALAGHALSPACSLGVQLGLWFPGEDAPSFDLSATTVDARGLFAFTPEHSPWALLASLGVRLDQSANAAPDLSQLRMGSRASLGLSDSHALLAALGLARRFGPRVELYTELSGDALVGAAAPALLESPLRAALGGRYAFDRSLQAELVTLIALSKRPGLAPSDPLVPIEPRFSILAAVSYRFALGERDSSTVQPDEATARAPAPPDAAAAPVRVRVIGTLTDDAGAPLPDTKVTLSAAGKERETITDAEGRYTFDGVPPGSATLRAQATGFATSSWEIAVQPGLPAQPARALSPGSETGVLRGLVRAFDSRPLRAQIEVRGPGGSVQRSDSAEDGKFELDLAPGEYRITIFAQGYRAQSRSVKIEGNGVTILNVDLREGT